MMVWVRVHSEFGLKRSSQVCQSGESDWFVVFVLLHVFLICYSLFLSAFVYVSRYLYVFLFVFSVMLLSCCSFHVVVVVLSFSCFHVLLCVVSGCA